jgi:spermidine synthase
MAPRLPVGQRAVASAVTLSESDGVRYLHFGSVWVQGAMRLRRPFALELDYQQQMMAPLLFLPSPEHVLQLGLGAAALTKFCWRHLPHTRLTVVEISPHVVAAARRWFRLPPDDERLQVVLDDARAVVGDPRRRRRHDWLQVDLYDAAARGPVLDDPAFYTACRRVLTNPGVAAFNLFGRSFETSFAAISSAFEDRVMVLPEAEGGNRVVLGFAGAPLRFDVQSLDAKASEIQRRLHLPARGWIEALSSQADAKGALCL